MHHAARLVHHAIAAERIFESSGNANKWEKHSLAAERIQGEWTDRTPLPDLEAGRTVYDSEMNRIDQRVLSALRDGSPLDIGLELRMKLETDKEWYPSQEIINGEII